MTLRLPFNPGSAAFGVTDWAVVDSALFSSFESFEVNDGAAAEPNDTFELTLPKPSADFSVPTLWTQAPTISIKNPPLKEAEAGHALSALAIKLDFNSVVDFLSHKVATVFSDADKVHYARFVADRVEPSLGLMQLFVIPENKSTLQEALEYFGAVFSVPENLEKRMKQMGLKAAEAFPGDILSMDQRTLMQWVYHDAASYLFDLEATINQTQGQIGQIRSGFDPDRLPRRATYDLSGLDALRQDANERTITDDELVTLYQRALEQRLVSQRLLQDTNATDHRKAPFYIGEGGLEVIGLTTALALDHAVGANKVLLAGHYRSGALINGLLQAQGYTDFNRDSIRQFLTRTTDTRGGGRDMGSHFHYPEYGIERILAPLGMNLAFASGGALREQIRAKNGEAGREIFYAEIGDATTATNEFYEFIDTSSILKLPVILNILDNGVGISVRAEEGRGTVNFRALAAAKGFEFITVDGNDILAVYQVQKKAALMAKEGKHVMIWNQNLPRLNSHSSSSGRSYRYQELDPLVQLSDALVKKGLLSENDALKRKSEALSAAPAFETVYSLGDLGDNLKIRVMNELFEPVWQEPITEIADVTSHIYPPFPLIQEVPSGIGNTDIPMNVAIRAALRDILRDHPLSFLWGQDLAEPKGGIFQATVGLSHYFKGRVFNGQINEPALVALATGFGLVKGAFGMVELPYDDYALNVIHRLTQAGLYTWLTNGKLSPHLMVRIPTEPVPPGAIYHSQWNGNFYTSIPGLVVVSPSTSWDAYGLLLSLAQYAGPSVVLEPKIMYRLAQGSAFRNEGDFDAQAIKAMKDGWTPQLDGAAIPLGKAAVRKSLPEGTEGYATIVTWGSAVPMALQAAAVLDTLDLFTEVIDLRTLMPWDRETVIASVAKTGALLVAHNGPTQSGLAEHIVNEVGVHFQAWINSYGAKYGRDLLFDVVGWDPRVPAMPQRPELNAGLSINPDRIVAKVAEMYGRAKPR